MLPNFDIFKTQTCSCSMFIFNFVLLASALSLPIREFGNVGIPDISDRIVNFGTINININGKRETKLSGNEGGIKVRKSIPASGPILFPSDAKRDSEILSGLEAAKFQGNAETPKTSNLSIIKSMELKDKTYININDKNKSLSSGESKSEQDSSKETEKEVNAFLEWLESGSNHVDLKPKPWDNQTLNSKNRTRTKDQAYSLLNLTPGFPQRPNCPNGQVKVSGRCIPSSAPNF